MAARPKRKKGQEREFEDLLLDVLEQDYDLSVRHAQEKVDRRKRDIATLTFEYRYDSPREAKAVVRVSGVPDFKALLPVDFSSPDGMRRSAEDCEALVLYLSEHLSEVREKNYSEAAAGRLRWGRREDD